MAMRICSVMCRYLETAGFCSLWSLFGGYTNSDTNAAIV